VIKIATDIPTDHMHSKYEDAFVTPLTCDLHHKLVEGKIEVVATRVKALEDKVTGIEHRIDIRMDAMDEKIEKILNLQENTYKILIYLAIGIILTLLGVITGRALDFGWLL
jgi:hypothetical protein